MSLSHDNAHDKANSGTTIIAYDLRNTIIDYFH